MKKLVVVLLTFFCIGFIQTAHAQESEHIQKYDTTIAVQKDGTIQVAETIDYFFDSPHHGIFRDIPVIKTNADGKKYQMTLSDISVTDETGTSYSFTRSRSGDNEELKIGDADTKITGLHQYDISYIVSGALTYFPAHDELYWNAVGTSWQVPIDQTTATIKLPQAVADADLHAACYVGAAGSTNTDCSLSKLDSSVVMEIDRTLDAYEGASIVVAFPKGIAAVLEPKEVVPFFSTLIGKITLVVIGFVSLLWYVIAPILVIRKWWISGRDPKPPMGEVSAWFSPPRTEKLRDLTPAETGALVDETVDLRDIYASLVDLARRGYMKIIETKKGVFDFEKGKDWSKDKDIQPFEDTLLSAIFEDGDRVKLKDLDLIATFSTVKNQIYTSLVSDNFFPQNPQSVRTKYYVLAGFALFTGNIILFLVAVIFGKNMPRKTVYGSQQAVMAKSLNHFLVSQDKQLKFQASKQMMFEKLLPYAIAFGVEVIWAKRFADLGLKQPAWYVSPYGGPFNTVVFANSIGKSATISFAASTMSKSSTGFSSGFSGGGFSGGGGGGGGGGSW